MGGCKPFTDASSVLQLLPSSHALEVRSLDVSTEVKTDLDQTWPTLM